ncbi:UDP-glucose/GDP-mannose dehydrogenase family protein [Bacillus circulans]|uniref:UDP-glucose dehydrogenase family protein n=1 Tax=Niallia circulans TaxID=1397 RepID=UPI0013D49039|nr:UDP-glucose/GDP-mannose dehydrogenase family protein [Niallia circulans]NRG28426.1 UDP-glucose/GDP-mannose dehydrogenase family protein [Niallia circulans]
MNITVVGTGYVGLVTGVSLSAIGHSVICLDVDKEKIEKMRLGISPIYEPGLSELMVENMERNRLFFTTSQYEAFLKADLIYIAVGTPEKEDGSADLSFIDEAAYSIAENIIKDTIVVIKSTVPVGTNRKVKERILQNLVHDVQVEMVANPEFLKEGTAIHDSFHGDRIVIGTDNERTARIMEKVNEAFGIPVYKTSIESAEMIKYASNAFLATKISFINEISNICERVQANIDEVAFGMGLDTRIGSQFLNAGIGYGGSCFPKDTKALIQIAGNVHYDFELLKGVVNVNKKQQVLLLNKLKDIYPNLTGKRIGVLGLAFKPNTDDMREAPSLLVIKELVENGAEVYAYDPIAVDNAKLLLPPQVIYTVSVTEAIQSADAVLILTEWDEIKQIDISLFYKMSNPIVIDGRNCFSLERMKKSDIEYHSVGRPSINEKIEELL